MTCGLSFQSTSSAETRYRTITTAARKTANNKSTFSRPSLSWLPESNLSALYSKIDIDARNNSRIPSGRVCALLYRRWLEQSIARVTRDRVIKRSWCCACIIHVLPRARISQEYTYAAPNIIHLKPSSAAREPYEKGCRAICIS